MCVSVRFTNTAAFLADRSRPLLLHDGTLPFLLFESLKLDDCSAPGDHSNGLGKT